MCYSIGKMIKKGGCWGPHFHQNWICYTRGTFPKNLNNDMQANAICLKGKAISIISKPGFITGKWNDKNAIHELLLGNSL